MIIRWRYHLGILLTHLIIRLAIRTGSAHLHAIFLALGDVLRPAAAHTLDDSEALHLRNLQENGTDERGDRIDLTVIGKGVFFDIEVSKLG